MAIRVLKCPNCGSTSISGSTIFLLVQQLFMGWKLERIGG